MSSRSKKSASKKSGSGKSVASKALALAQQNKKAIQTEIFSLSTAMTVDPNSTGTVQNLSAVGQALTAAGRTGLSIRAFSLRMKGSVQLHSSATASRVRVVVAYDRSGTTAAPAITDLFTDAGEMADNLLTIGSPQVSSRFQVISDKLYIVVTNRPIVSFDIYKKLNKAIHFSGAGSTDEGRNNLWLFMASNEATNDPVFTGEARFKYMD